jgi:hypothetical protein
VLRRQAETAHRLELLAQPTLTLIATGPGTSTLGVPPRRRHLAALEHLPARRLLRRRPRRPTGTRPRPPTRRVATLVTGTLDPVSTRSTRLPTETYACARVDSWATFGPTIRARPSAGSVGHQQRVE